LVRIKVRKF